MPETVQAAPHRSRNSFADLLASFTGRLQSDEWDDSALEDDITNISYEEALRAARRSRIPHGTSNQVIAEETEKAVGRRTRSQEAVFSSEKGRRGASITIRVTAEEHAQLQTRAAAAEVSVSAYLRSCVFEAEVLRAEVKEALAQMQAAQVAARSEPEGRTGWRRLVPNWWRSRTVEG